MNHLVMRILPNIRNSRTCLTRKTLTPCWNIIHDCTINLKEGTQLPFRPIYNSFQDILAAICEYIEEKFEKGFIQHSKSPTDAPILFVKKRDNSLWLCVDYCGLDWFAIKNWYPLPLILRSLDQLNHAKVYTKIYLCRAYNLVCIRKVINERQHLEHVKTISNTLWWLLALPMHLLYFNI